MERKCTYNVIMYNFKVQLKVKGQKCKTWSSSRSESKIIFS